MISRFGVIVASACVVFSVHDARAQQKTAVAFRSDAAALVAPAVTHAAVTVQEQEHDQVKPEDEMGTSGFFLGIIGMMAGAAVGSQVGQSQCPNEDIDKDCMQNHAYTGALIAGTVFTPLGVHLASKHPKNLPLALGLSAVTSAALYYGFKAIPGSPIAMAPFLAAPLQVFMSVKLEQRK